MKYTNKVHDNEYQYYKNRISLIHLMLISFSSLLYTEIKEIDNHFDPLLCLFSSNWNTKSEEIIWSLLNFALFYELSSFVFLEAHNR